MKFWMIINSKNLQIYCLPELDIIFLFQLYFLQYYFVVHAQRCSSHSRNISDFLYVSCCRFTLPLVPHLWFMQLWLDATADPLWKRGPWSMRGGGSWGGKIARKIYRTISRFLQLVMKPKLSFSWQVKNVIEKPHNDHLPLIEASRYANCSLTLLII